MNAFNVLSALAAIIGGGGVVALINALARRRLTRADAESRLSDSTLKWVEQFQREAAGARQEASDMRREAADARREASEARAEWRQMRMQMQHEMQDLADRIRRIREAVWSPTATLESVRTVVNGFPPSFEPSP